MLEAQAASSRTGRVASPDILWRMRVIGGSRRGFPLVAPRGRSTRPTLDHVRQNLFDILGEVKGARLLDLFSGSGSFGVEGLSRGAEHACFVETGREALEALRRNLEKTRFIERAAIVRRDVFALGGGLPGAPFDVVFADPPFKLLHAPSGFKDLGAVLGALDEAGSLSRDVRVVVEHETTSPAPGALGPLSLIDRRRHGRATLAFFTRPATVK